MRNYLAIVISSLRTKKSKNNMPDSIIVKLCRAEAKRASWRILLVLPFIPLAFLLSIIATTIKKGKELIKSLT